MTLKPRTTKLPKEMNNIITGDLVVPKHQLAFKTLEDFRRVLPVIARLLGIARWRKDYKNQLEVLYPDTLKTDYMEDSKLKDRVIKVESIDGSLPVIRLAGNQQATVTPVIGLALFECRDKPGLRYVRFYSRDYNDYGTQYIVVPKGKVYALKRHTLEQSKKHNLLEGPPPILEKGLRDKIYNNTVGFLRRCEEMEVYNLAIRRGVLLMGSPGNGKTMLCRWLMSECEQHNISCGSIDGAQIVATFGKGQKLDEVFNKYVLTIFDDIDVSLLSRKGKHAEVACSLLAAMQGVNDDDKDHRIRIFTTNEKIDDLDEAFVRPGRIDCCYEFKKPTPELIQQLIEKFWSKEILEYLTSNDLLKLLTKLDVSFAELESIRSFLIMHKLNEGKWDIQHAINNFEKRLDNFSDQEKSSVGF